MGFVNWIFNQLASKDVIDLYFILSDLVDLPLDKGNQVESAIQSGLSQNIANKYKNAGYTYDTKTRRVHGPGIGKDGVPIARFVL